MKTTVVLEVEMDFGKDIQDPQERWDYKMVEFDVEAETSVGYEEVGSTLERVEFGGITYIKWDESLYHPHENLAIQRWIESNRNHIYEEAIEN